MHKVCCSVYGVYVNRFFRLLPAGGGFLPYYHMFGKERRKLLFQKVFHRHIIFRNKVDAPLVFNLFILFKTVFYNFACFESGINK